MSRKNLFHLSVLILVIATVSSCSKKAGEYTHVIPSDAVVISVNVTSLTDKAGIQDNNAEQIKQTLLDAVARGVSSSSRTQLEKVIRNPSESGIAINEPFYIFGSPVTHGKIAMTAKVNNIKDLRNTLEVLANEGASTQISSRNGYEYIVLGQYGPLVAFNETTFLLFSNGDRDIERMQRDADVLMNQTAENSISGKKGFEKMVDKKGEITFWAPFAAFPNADMIKSSMGISSDIDLKKISVIGGLAFEKGKVTAEMEYYTEDKASKELLDKRTKAMGSLSNTYLKNLPSSTLGFMSFALHGEEVYKMLQDNTEFRHSVPADAAEKMESLFKGFNGDITLALTGVSLDRRFNPTPSFLMLADVKKEAIQELHKLIEEEGAGLSIRKRADGEYVMSADFDIFLGERDQTFYMTNDLSLLANLDKGLDKSIKDSKYASHAKGKSMYAAIDIQSILDMPLVKLATGMGGEETQMYYQLGSLFEYIEMYIEKDSKTILTLQLQNQETNALKQMVDFARGFAGL